MSLLLLVVALVVVVVGSGGGGCVLLWVFGVCCYCHRYRYRCLWCLKLFVLLLLMALLGCCVHSRSAVET